MRRSWTMAMVFTVSCLLMFFTTGYAISAQTTNPDDLRDRALIGALSPAIYNAITGYYGKTKLFDSEKILSVETEDPSGGNVYIVKVQVRTFEGSHNPPYGLENLSLRISFPGITVIHFDHQDYTPKPQQ